MRRYWIVFGLALVIFFAELLGGFYSGSLALISDAFHVFTDGYAIFVSIIVTFLVSKCESEIDIKRIRAWGGYFNATALGIVSIGILHESFVRIVVPREVTTSTMIVFAIAGLVGNFFQHSILRPDHAKYSHITHKSLHVHVLSDLYQSIAVIVAGMVIWLTGFTVVDSLLSAVVAGWMMVQTKRLFIASYKESRKSID